MAALAASSFQRLERNAGKDSTLVDAVPSYTLRGEITLDKAQTSHSVPVVDSFSKGLKRVVGVVLTPLNQIASNIVGDKIGPFFATGFPVASDAIVATTPDISGQASNPSFAIQITGYVE